MFRAVLETGGPTAAPLINLTKYMMKKIICILLPLVLGSMGAFAQSGAPELAGRTYFAIQGGPVFNLYENAFTYRDNGRFGDLFTSEVAALFGCDFNEVYGARVQLGYGSDAGAANVLQTAGGGFYPYTFRHLNLFGDATLNLAALANKGKATYFRPKLYAGIGYAYTFHFSDSGHPWQTIYNSNSSFGFRGGFIGEFTFPAGFGIYVDMGGEAYTDLYNGLQPTAQDQEGFVGYAGFPLDLRAKIDLGLVLHF